MNSINLKQISESQKLAMVLIVTLLIGIGGILSINLNSTNVGVASENNNNLFSDSINSFFSSKMGLTGYSVKDSGILDVGVDDSSENENLLEVQGEWTGCQSGPILTPGIFTLTQDDTTTETCFLISTDDLWIDCQGHTFTNDLGDSGVYVSNSRDNISVFNCTFINFSSGVDIHGASIGSNISYVNIYNSVYGIKLGSTSGGVTNSYFINNQIINTTQEAIKFDSFETNTGNYFINNYLQNFSKGFLIVSEDSAINYFYNNQLINGTIFGFQFGQNTTSILINNTISNVLQRSLELNSDAEVESIDTTLINAGLYAIDDTTDPGNYSSLIYNNSFGLINWTKEDLTIGAFDLEVGSTIFLEENNIGLADLPGLSSLDSFAQIEIKGVDFTGDPQLVKLGTNCSSPNCNVTSSLSGQYVKADVNGFSNYSIYQEETTQEYFTFQINTSHIAGTNFSFQADDANLTVWWNETNYTNYVDYDGLMWHNYSTEGIYNISVNGTASRISFYEGTEDALIDILTNVSNGVSGITSAYRMFMDADNFGITPLTEPNFFDELSENITTLQSIFSSSSFNQDVSNWNVSNVITMSESFSNSPFNQNIDNWDVSNVKDMSLMFNYAQDFNQNLSNWNVSNVLDMRNMFSGAFDFNGNITDWDVSNVINMNSMFNNALNFNQNISSWNVSNVTNMGYMFRSTYDFNQDIGSWDVSNVEQMDFMFNIVSDFNQDISAWNVSKVTNMNSMFRQSESFNQNLSSWDVSNVQNMRNMFYNSVFDQDISSWNVSNAVDMSYMFYDSIFDQNISSWDVSNVTDMTHMFQNSDFNQNISSWNVSNLIDMGYMFWNSQFNQSIGEWDVSSVTNMNSTFIYSQFDQDISSWNVSNVVDMSYMFYDSFFDQDIGAWNVSSVTDMSGMFESYQLSRENYDSLLNGWAELTLTDSVIFGAGNSQYCLGETARNSILTNESEYNWTITDGGKNCSGISFDPTNKFTFQINTSHIAGTNFSFQADDANLTVWWNETNYTNYTDYTGLMWHNYSADGIYNISVNGTASRISFFEGAEDALIDILTNISLGVSGITNAENMFRDTVNFGITQLTEPNFFDEISENITTMQYMFSGSKFNQDISSWDVSNVTNMYVLFGNSPFNQDISSWNVSNVGTMGYMFSNTIFNQDISSWDVSNVVVMANMFANSFFNQDISSWDVSNVTNMYAMFGNSPFNQDIGSWNVSNVINLQYMFQDSQLSRENYDSLLNGWAELTLTDSVNFEAGNSQYCLGEESRNDTLIDTYNWVITDGGKNCSGIINNLPIINDLILNSTNNLINNTNQNLTSYWTVSDDDEDSVKNITDWKVNGTSLFIANIPFEGGSNFSFTKDYSPIENEIIVNGADWISTGGFDGRGAYDFTQNTDVVSIMSSANNDLTGKYGITFSVWIYPTSSSAWSRIFYRKWSTVDEDPWSAYSMYFDDAGKIGFALTLDDNNAYGTTTSSAIPLNQWLNIVGRYNGTNISIYVNGVLNNTAQGNGSLIPLGDPIINGNIDIGKNTFKTTQTFSGLIDEFMIFNRSLSDEQIFVIYENKSNILVSEETTTGENWSFCVTPNDGIGDGNQVCSNEVEILGGDCDYYINSCGNLNNPGNYCLTENLTSSETCLTLNNNSITLDCQGYNVTGDNSVDNSQGITSPEGNFENGTIQNCEISGFEQGIYLNNFNNVLIFNNTVFNNYFGQSGAGIYLSGGVNVSLSDNNIYDNYEYGISLNQVSNSSIFNNLIYNISDGASWVSKGIYSDASFNLTFFNNFINSSSDGFYGSGNYINFSNNQIWNMNTTGAKLNNINNSILEYNIMTNMRPASTSIRISNPINLSFRFNNLTNVSRLLSIGETLENQILLESNNFNSYYLYTYNINLGSVSILADNNYWNGSTCEQIMSMVDHDDDSKFFLTNVLNDSWPQGIPEDCGELYCGQFVNESKNLTENRQCEHEWIKIVEDNITIDGLNNLINYSRGTRTSNGITALNVVNITVQNCSLLRPDGYQQDQPAIYFENVSQSEIFNNSFNILGYEHYSYPVYLYESQLIDVYDNYMNTECYYCYGVFTKNSDQITIHNNTVNTSMLDAHGFKSEYSTNIDYFLNNITANAYLSEGFRIEDSENVSIINNFFNATSYSSNPVNAQSTINLTIESNEFLTPGSGGLSISGTQYSHFDHNIANNNTIDGFSIWVNKSVQNHQLNNELLNDFGQVICLNCENVSYYNTTFGIDGLGLFGGTNISLINSSFSTSTSGSILDYTLANFNFLNSSINGAGPTNYGLVINSINATIQNSLINTAGSGVDSIQVNSEGFVINNSEIFSGPLALRLNNADFSFVDNINTTTVSGQGIVLEWSDFVIIKNSNINSTSYSLRNYYSDNNLFENLDLYSESNCGLFLYAGDAENLTLKDSIIKHNSANSVCSQDNNIMARLLNTSFNHSKNFSFSNSDGAIFVDWYVQFNVTNITEEQLDLAEIQILNVTGDLIESVNTNSSGLTEMLTIREFNQTSSNKTMMTPHDVTIDLAGFEQENFMLNLSETESTLQNITLIPTGYYQEVSECGVLDTEDMYYKLVADLESNETCITIAAEGITLDCQEHSINYSINESFGYGINNSGYTEVNINNCTVKTSSGWGAGPAIYFNGSQGGIHNSNITMPEDNSAIYVDYPTVSVNISNNYISAVGASGEGITFAGFNSYIENNFIEVDVVDAIRIVQYGFANKIFNNTIYSELATQIGINIVDSYNQGNPNGLNNNISSNKLTNSQIWIQNSNNNFLEDNKINSTEYNSIGLINSFNLSIDSSNLVEGFSVYYNESIENEILLENEIVNETYGQIICNNCSNITYNNVTFGSDGITFFNSANISINNSRGISGVGSLVWAYNSKDINITFSVFNSSQEEEDGMSLFSLNLYQSNNSNIYGNTFIADKTDTFSLYYSSVNDVFVSNNLFDLNSYRSRGISCGSCTGELSFNYNNFSIGGNYSQAFYYLPSHAEISHNKFNSSNVIEDLSYVLDSNIFDSTNLTIYNNSFYGYLRLMNLRGYSYNVSNNYFDMDDSDQSLLTLSTSNSFFNNNIMGCPSNYCVQLVAGTNNNFTNNTLIGDDSIVIDDGSGIFIDGELNTTGIYFSGSAAGNITIAQSVYFNITNSTLDGLDNSQVLVNDLFGAGVINAMTNSTGLTGYYVLNEFLENKTERINYSPHQVNVSLAGYNSNNSLVNISELEDFEIQKTLEIFVGGSLAIQQNEPAEFLLIDNGAIFNYSVNISCQDGPCGNITLILDPQDSEEKGNVTLDSSGDKTKQIVSINSVNLEDNNSFLYDVQLSGCYLTEGQSDAYDGFFDLNVNYSEYGGLRFEDNSLEGWANCESQIISDLNITRKIYVSDQENWIRYLEILQNPTEQEICVNVSISGDLGSDSSTVCVNTSDGDNDFTIADSWFITDDEGDLGGGSENDPTLAFVFQEDNFGVERIDSAYCADGDDMPYWQWNDTCVFPGETKILMHYGVQQTDRSAALVEVLDIQENFLSEIHTARMSDAEQEQIINWGFSKGVIPNGSGNPFYTVSENPRTSITDNCLTNMQADESCEINWTVHTNSSGGDYTFFVIAESDISEVLGVLSSNVTILVDGANPELVSKQPQNDAIFGDGPISQDFNCTFSDDVNLSNISLYITDETDQNFVLNSSQNKIGLENTSDWNLDLIDGNYTWACLAKDQFGKQAWSQNNTVEVGYSGFLIDECINITLPGNYILSNSINSISGNCININVSNVNLDCLENTISSSNMNNGINVEDADNISITGCSFENLSRGINIVGNYGIYLNNLNINRNQVTSNNVSYGIYLYYINNSIIQNNLFESLPYAIYGDYSDNLLVQNNNFDSGDSVLRIYYVNNLSFNQNNLTSISSDVINLQGVLLGSGDKLNISQNNFIDTSSTLYFSGAFNVSAQQNYWNSTSCSEIISKIGYQGGTKFEFEPFLDDVWPAGEEQDCGEEIYCGMIIDESINLTQDLSCDSNGLNFGGSNLVIDCKGYKIKSENIYSYYTAIRDLYNSNNTIQNCSVEQFRSGVGGDGTNLTIKYNNFTNHTSLLSYYGSVNLSYNNFFNISETFLLVDGEIIAENNYWNSTDCNEISNKISRNHLGSNIVFYPVLDAPWPIGQPRDCQSPYCNEFLNHSIILTEDLNCLVNGLIIDNENITVDCAGHTIRYSGDDYYSDYTTGLNIERTNATIKNCNVSNFYDGIRGYFTDRINLSDIEIYNSSQFGITFNNVPYSNLNNLSLINNERAIEFQDQPDTNVTNSLIYNTQLMDYVNVDLLRLHGTNLFFENITIENISAEYCSSFSAINVRDMSHSEFRNVVIKNMSNPGGCDSYYEANGIYVSSYGYTYDNITFVNLDIQNVSDKSIYTPYAAEINYVFDTENGTISWQNKSAVDINATSFVLGEQVFIEENLLGLADNELLSNLNSTAQLIFKGLGHPAEPEILKNGVLCGEEEGCNVTYFNSQEDMLIVEVDSFSNYSTQLNLIDYEFSVEVGENVTGSVGENVSYVVNVTNEGLISDNYTIYLDSNETDYANINQTEFDQVGFGEQISFNLTTRDDSPGDYLAGVYVRSEGNNSNDLLIQFNTTFETQAGIINVTKLNPLGSEETVQYNTIFNYSILVGCELGDCGNISSELFRYNNTEIEIVPYWSGNPYRSINPTPKNYTNYSCLGNMTQGDTCQLDWLVFSEELPGLNSMVYANLSSDVLGFSNTMSDEVNITMDYISGNLNQTRIVPISNQLFKSPDDYINYTILVGCNVISGCNDLTVSLYWYNNTDHELVPYNSGTPFRDIISNPKTKFTDECLDDMLFEETCQLEWGIIVDSNVPNSEYDIYSNITSSSEGILPIVTEELNITIGETTEIEINLIEPQNTITNFTQNEFNNYSVNISCVGSNDCGIITAGVYFQNISNDTFEQVFSFYDVSDLTSIARYDYSGESIFSFSEYNKSLNSISEGGDYVYLASTEDDIYQYDLVTGELTNNWDAVMDGDIGWATEVVSDNQSNFYYTTLASEVVAKRNSSGDSQWYYNFDESASQSIEGIALSNDDRLFLYSEENLTILNNLDSETPSFYANLTYEGETIKAVVAEHNSNRMFFVVTKDDTTGNLSFYQYDDGDGVTWNGDELTGSLSFLPADYNISSESDALLGAEMTAWVYPVVLFKNKDDSYAYNLISFEWNFENVFINSQIRPGNESESYSNYNLRTEKSGDDPVTTVSATSTAGDGKILIHDYNGNYISEYNYSQLPINLVSFNLNGLNIAESANETIPFNFGAYFYVNTSNPTQTNFLLSGESEIINWYVNATGPLFSSYILQSESYLSETPFVNSSSQILNITIVSAGESNFSGLVELTNPIVCSNGYTSGNGDFNISNETVICENGLLEVMGDINIFESMQGDSEFIEVNNFTLDEIGYVDFVEENYIGSVNIPVDISFVDQNYSPDWDSGIGEFRITFNEANKIGVYLDNVPENVIYMIDTDGNSSLGVNFGGPMNGTEVIFGNIGGNYVAGCWNETAPMEQPFTFLESGDYCDNSFHSNIGSNTTVIYDTFGTAAEYVFDVTSGWHEEELLVWVVQFNASAGDNGEMGYTLFASTNLSGFGEVESGSEGNLIIRNVTLKPEGSINSFGNLSINYSIVEFQMTENGSSNFSIGSGEYDQEYSAIANISLSEIRSNDSEYYWGFRVYGVDHVTLFDNDFSDSGLVGDQWGWTHDNRFGQCYNLSIVSNIFSNSAEQRSVNLADTIYDLEFVSNEIKNYASLSISDILGENTSVVISSNILGSLFIENLNDTLFENNTIIGSMILANEAEQNSSNNTFLNNNFQGGIIDNNYLFENVLVYNNSYGEFRVESNNISIEPGPYSLGLGMSELFIENNNITIETIFESWNATLKFYDLPWSGGVNLTRNNILQLECNYYECEYNNITGIMQVNQTELPIDVTYSTVGNMGVFEEHTFLESFFDDFSPNLNLSFYELDLDELGVIFSSDDYLHAEFDLTQEESSSVEVITLNYVEPSVDFEAFVNVSLHPELGSFEEDAVLSSGLFVFNEFNDDLFFGCDFIYNSSGYYFMGESDIDETNLPISGVADSGILSLSFDSVNNQSTCSYDGNEITFNATVGEDYVLALGMGLDRDENWDNVTGAGNVSMDDLTFTTISPGFLESFFDDFSPNLNLSFYNLDVNELGVNFSSIDYLHSEFDLTQETGSIVDIITFDYLEIGEDFDASVYVNLFPEIGSFTEDAYLFNAISVFNVEDDDLYFGCEVSYNSSGYYFKGRSDIDETNLPIGEVSSSGLINMSFDSVNNQSTCSYDGNEIIFNATVGSEYILALNMGLDRDYEYTNVTGIGNVSMDDLTFNIESPGELESFFDNFSEFNESFYDVSDEDNASYETTPALFMNESIEDDSGIYVDFLTEDYVPLNNFSLSMEVNLIPQIGSFENGTYLLSYVGVVSSGEDDDWYGCELRYNSSGYFFSAVSEPDFIGTSAQIVGEGKITFTYNSSDNSSVCLFDNTSIQFSAPLVPLEFKVAMSMGIDNDNEQTFGNGEGNVTIDNLNYTIIHTFENDVPVIPQTPGGGSGGGGSDNPVTHYVIPTYDGVDISVNSKDKITLLYEGQEYDYKISQLTTSLLLLSRLYSPYLYNFVPGSEVTIGVSNIFEDQVIITYTQIGKLDVMNFKLYASPKKPNYNLLPPKKKVFTPIIDDPIIPEEDTFIPEKILEEIQDMIEVPVLEEMPKEPIWDKIKSLLWFVLYVCLILGVVAGASYAVPKTYSYLSYVWPLRRFNPSDLLKGRPQRKLDQVSNKFESVKHEDSQIEKIEQNKVETSKVKNNKLEQVIEPVKIIPEVKPIENPTPIEESNSVESDNQIMGHVDLNEIDSKINLAFKKSEIDSLDEHDTRIDTVHDALEEINQALDKVKKEMKDSNKKE
ncbi:BspA family leucine-rich repeat surface protein [Candidatus Woesearchaeota archaeon]|jgi:surface protein|nr:BspA family leucine-rich repeat surface protein [Candidatus Woesearchaeota archaeon]